ncbi:hypothetical protein [Motiliproteus sediminis]|uniref:hypothetical protein n=1 Tax=Motiliproteus sediminis TaxID=1468178 RepID=UPI001AEF8692|nr:hypothetical protein [Motiliproteus sediminis]
MEAALDSGVTPELISCTSGQIYWTWRYLLQSHDEKDPLTGESVSLYRELMRDIDKTNMLPQSLSWLDGPLMAMVGDPGIFQPAVADYWRNLSKPYFSFDAEHYWDQLRHEALNRLMPAMVFVPERSREALTAIGMRFATENNIGLMFNAYDVPAGEEVLYLNRRAQALLQDGRPGRYRDAKCHNGTLVRVLDESDPEMVFEAVDAALWLYLYGFRDRQGRARTRVDGAYHRQMIIRELVPAATRIYAVRPQTNEWRGKLPQNALEVANFVTLVWFNASYPGETAEIALINELLDKQLLQPGKPYSKIELVPVEYQARIRYYEYFVEREAVYQAAYRRASEVFARHAAARVA